MAENMTEKAKAPQAKLQNTVETHKKKKQEAVYSAEEFAANAEALFGVPPECVEAAFRESGITSCTKKEAEETVKKFRKQEVE